MRPANSCPGTRGSGGRRVERAVIRLQVAAAEASGGDGDDDLIRAGRGIGERAEGQRAGLMADAGECVHQRAVQPPSMVSVAPVMNPPAAEASRR